MVLFCPSMDSKLLNLLNKFKITQFRVQMKKKYGLVKSKGGFSKTLHTTPLKVCEFSVYLMASNDSKIDIDRFYSLLEFHRDQNHCILRSNERAVIV